MLISKTEYLYAKKMKNDLLLKIAAFEANSATYKMWRKWLSMSPEAKKELEEKWNTYYKACRESYYGKMYQQARGHMKAFLNAVTEEGKRIEKERLNTIIATVKISKEPFITTPSSLDPSELLIKLEPYFMAKQQQKEFQHSFEEFEEIYEPKKNKGIESM